jgi:hypothetical protein
LRTESDKIFEAENNFKESQPPMDAHSGTGEAAAYIDISADEKGKCRCGVYNQSIGVEVDLEFPKSQLPWLTNWQHWGKKEYVTALEPGTHPPIGQAKAREDGSLIQLEVGETKAYDITLTVND